MKKWKMLVVIVTGLVWAAGIAGPAAVCASSYAVTVDGTAVNFSDQTPYDKDGRIMVPVRAPMEALGAVVEWNNASQSVTLSKDGTTAVFTLGQTDYTVNGEIKTMDVAPEAIANRVAFPVRYCAEAIGATVSFNAARGMVEINSGPAAPQTPSNSSGDETAMRIQLLERALAPETADQAANDWAQAVATRNGAWQYAIMSDEMRAANLASFEMSWVTGFSSPWVTDYTVANVPAQTSATDGIYVYHVVFSWTTSAHDLAISEGDITVVSNDEGYSAPVYLISDIAFDPFDMH